MKEHAGTLEVDRNDVNETARLAQTSERVRRWGEKRKGPRARARAREKAESDRTEDEPTRGCQGMRKRGGEGRKFVAKMKLPHRESSALHEITPW